MNYTYERHPLLAVYYSRQSEPNTEKNTREHNTTITMVINSVIAKLVLIQPLLSFSCKNVFLLPFLCEVNLQH